MWSSEQVKRVQWLDFEHGSVLVVASLWPRGQACVNAGGCPDVVHVGDGADDVAASALVQGF